MIPEFSQTPPPFPTNNVGQLSPVGWRRREGLRTDYTPLPPAALPSSRACLQPSACWGQFIPACVDDALHEISQIPRRAAEQHAWSIGRLLGN